MFATAQGNVKKTPWISTTARAATAHRHQPEGRRRAHLREARGQGEKVIMVSSAGKAILWMSRRLAPWAAAPWACAA